jgi:radical SAM superfamily enzyme YgiQ (UPF0313 family)
MTRILFVNPEQNQKGAIAMYPSGALILMATMCQNAGHEVRIHDGAVDNTDIRKVIADFKPTIACITCNTFQTKHANKYLDLIKKTDRRILTVIGGPHPSAIGIQTLTDFPNADIAVMGEGEFTFMEIVDGLCVNYDVNKVTYSIKKAHEIKGICYRHTIVGNTMTEPRPPTANLDHIPLPNLDLVDITKYAGINGDPNERTMFMMCSRGCPFDCIYCNKSVFGRHVRYRKPEKIIEEIKWLHDKYGINHVYFQDDTFNLKLGWTEDILNMIIDEGLNKDIKYMAPFRANNNLVDEELLALAKKANFQTIFYGVESGNQAMLDRMHKGLKLAELERAFRLTHRAGINTVGAFIIGLPGETRHTVKDTIRFWRKIRPTYSGFTMATPFPNTKFESEIKSKGQLLNSNYNEYRCGGSYVRTDELTRNELEFYTAVAILGQDNEWIYYFPIFAIGKNPLLRMVAVFGINVYRKFKEMYNK